MELEMIKNEIIFILNSQISTKTPILHRFY